jgi:hypothetical protein
MKVVRTNRHEMRMSFAEFMEANQRILPGEVFPVVTDVPDFDRMHCIP